MFTHESEKARTANCHKILLASYLNRNRTYGMVIASFRTLAGCGLGVKTHNDPVYD